MAGRFLRMFQPLSRFVPEISPPQRKVGFNEKLFWTAMALALYLVMSEVPLYLPPGAGGGDPLLYLRVIFASNRGTLMELGIGPIVTAGIILQLLAGSNMIQCDMSNPDDRALFTTATKVFSIIMTGVQASAYLIGGMYGSLLPARSMVVFIQLMFAGILLMLLDELLQKGWGIGSGISLFIMAGVAQTIAWSCLSPIPVEDGKLSGALIAFFQTILSGQSLSSVFFRPGNNMLGFITTIVVFLIVIYAEGVRIELPISYARYRGFRGRYPIKLLYVSNLPVIFASALFANIYFISQLLWNQPWGRNNFWVSLLGQYAVGEGGQSQPVGGLVYYVISPQNLSDVASDPIRALGFVAIMVAFCVVFSLTWLEVGGLGPKMVAKQLIDSGMQIPGFRRSSKTIESLLNRYIPTVAVLGGALVGLIASVANFFGVFGTGMGILLAVGILYQYYQLLMQERVTEMYPALRRFLGG
ncbi:preprotein translocase subunit SecY [Candidatus Bathyarchaeota archaeon]|nr:MAG: preprotein translocase subunit SecY [Candidatus Bathyarchaeota archaeon]